jgi:hypothetical protein
MRDEDAAKLLHALRRECPHIGLVQCFRRSKHPVDIKKDDLPHCLSASIPSIWFLLGDPYFYLDDPDPGFPLHCNWKQAQVLLDQPSVPI